MSEYGVTSTGFVKKRLDSIIKEIQADLTDALGFDVSLNPQSALNVIITKAMALTIEKRAVGQELLESDIDTLLLFFLF